MIANAAPRKLGLVSGHPVLGSAAIFAVLPAGGGDRGKLLRDGDVTTHLNFRGQARAALDFYRTVFGGEQTLMTYGAMGQAGVAESPDHIIWGQVAPETAWMNPAFTADTPRPVGLAAQQRAGPT